MMQQPSPWIYQGWSLRSCSSRFKATIPLVPSQALTARVWYNLHTLVRCHWPLSVSGRSVWFLEACQSKHDCETPDLARWRESRWKEILAYTEVGGWTQGTLGVNGDLRLISSIRVSCPRFSETASVDDYCSLTGPGSSLMNSTTRLCLGSWRGVNPHGCVVLLSLSLREPAQTFSLLGQCFNIYSLEGLQGAVVLWTPLGPNCISCMMLHEDMFESKYLTLYIIVLISSAFCYM